MPKAVEQRSCAPSLGAPGTATGVEREFSAMLNGVTPVFCSVRFQAKWEGVNGMFKWMRGMTNVEQLFQCGRGRVEHLPCAGSAR